MPVSRTANKSGRLSAPPYSDQYAKRDDGGVALYDFGSALSVAGRNDDHEQAAGDDDEAPEDRQMFGFYCGSEWPQVLIANEGSADGEE